MADHKHGNHLDTSTLSGLYELPRIYDILHIPGTKEDSASLFQLADTFVESPARKRGHWLEPACGSGRLIINAARQGVRATGIDLHVGMIRFARKATPPKLKKLATFKQGDICYLDTLVNPASIDFAFNPINTIRHLQTDAKMIRHLSGMARVLKPGGVYVVGLSLSAYGDESDNEDRWEGVLGKTRVIQNVLYLPAKGGKTLQGRQEKVISHLTIYEGAKIRHVDDTYVLRSYNLEQWLKLLERSKLRVIEIVDERGTPLEPAEPGYSIFVLAHKTDPRAQSSRWHAG